MEGTSSARHQLWLAKTTQVCVILPSTSTRNTSSFFSHFFYEVCCLCALTAPDADDEDDEEDDGEEVTQSQIYLASIQRNTWDQTSKVRCDDSELRDALVL